MWMPPIRVGDTTCQLNALGALWPLPRPEAMQAVLAHLGGMHAVTLAYAIRDFGDAAFVAEKERRPKKERKAVERALAELARAGEEGGGDG